MSTTNVTQGTISELFSHNGTSDSPTWSNQTNLTTEYDGSNKENTGDISDELTEDITFAFECVAMPILVLVGITGNVVSLVVLSHRKLRSSSTTILLIGLAISDCLYLMTTMVRKSTCIIGRIDPLLSYRYFVLSFSIVYYINTCFSRVSTLLVAVISMERMIAVTLPLKVKLLCTKTRMKVAVVATFVFTFGFLALLTQQYDIKYRNDTPYLRRNAFFLDNEQFVDIYNKYVTVAVLRWLPKVIVVMCNGIIITIFARRSFPVETFENASTLPKYSKTQRRVTIMMVTVAIVFVVTLLPGDAFWITSIVVDEFKIYGKYNNYFSVLSDITLTFEILNASVNFVIYMVLNSTFTKVYLVIFCPCHLTARQFQQSGSTSRCSIQTSTTKGDQRLHESVSNISGTTPDSIGISRDTLYTI